MSEKDSRTFFQSPIGALEITAENNAIISIKFYDVKKLPDSKPTPILKEAVQQLDEYFRKQRRHFTVKIAPRGTVFQKSVWEEIAKINYGDTASYLEIAKRLDNVMAVRAVGNANGKNPIPIIIPCHRIVGANCKLIGYSGGLWRKEWLLKHENAVIL